MKKESKYIEGPKASENFERLARAVFQAPKSAKRVATKRQPKKATAHKASGKAEG
jgi:hypothetical protein